MAIEAYPVKFEIMDEGECLAKVETFDVSAATVKIDTCVDDKSWPELSAKIQECLVLMRLGE